MSLNIKNESDKTDKQKILEEIFALQRFGIKPGLERTLDLLGYLGNPHNNLKCFHISGTNGKGSVASIIASILAEAGYKTGLYTSPHLVEFNERIRINRVKISDDYLIDYYYGIKEKSIQVGATFFELTTALAFKYFADNNVDYAIIEAGMGGRYDSTNVIIPLVSVITPIGLDHQKYLGSTIEEISFDKSGIIKPGVPVVTSSQEQAAIEIISNVAKEKESELFHVDLNSIINNSTNEDLTQSIELEINDVVREFTFPGPGNFRAINLQTAISALNAAGMEKIIESGACESGIINIIRNSGYRGRIDVISRNPIKIIDTAHNPHAVKSLVDALTKVPVFAPNIYFSMMNDKDIQKCLEQIRIISPNLNIVRLPIDRAAQPGEIKAIAENSGFKRIHITESIEELISDFFESSQQSLALGSFYLAEHLYRHMDVDKN